MYRQKYSPKFSKFNYSVGALILKDQPEFCAAIGSARQNFHDMNGIADHVGGAVLAFRACGHIDSVRACR
jgi:hypothetical protein